MWGNPSLKNDQNTTIMDTEDYIDSVKKKLKEIKN